MHLVYRGGVDGRDNGGNLFINPVALPPFNNSALQIGASPKHGGIRGPKAHALAGPENRNIFAGPLCPILGPDGVS